MHFDVLCYQWLPFPPKYLLIALLGVLREAGLTLLNCITWPPSSLAFWVGVAKGKHQQETGGKEGESGCFSIPFPPCCRVRLWRWLYPFAPFQRLLKEYLRVLHRSICISFLGLLE